MRLILGKITSGLITIGGWLLFGGRLVLDLIGYSTVPEDVAVAKTRHEQSLDLFLSIPWWALLGFALISTLWLTWVSWPRTPDKGEKAEPHGQAASASKRLILVPTRSIPDGRNNTDPPDIHDARLRLASFYTNTLMPASNALREAVLQSAGALVDYDPKSPQAEMAWNGVHSQQLPTPNQIFETLPILKGVPLDQAMEEVNVAMKKYKLAAWRVIYVVQKLDGNRKHLHRLIEPLKSWLPLHEKLKTEFQIIERDIYFAPIKKAHAEMPFDNARHPEKFIQNLVAT